MSAQLGIAADSPQKLNLLIGQFENAHTYTTIAELVHHFQTGQLHITLSIQGNALTMTHLWGQRKLLCPFSLREALTFVDEGRRRFEKTHPLGRTVFDPLTGALFYPQKLKLSEKETALLVCLLKASRGGVSRLNLLKAVWGYDERLETRTLETHIYQLRQKIEHDPSTPSILVSTSSGYEITIERQGKVLYNQDKAFSG